nr:hypothetical protein [Homo sapiens]
MATAAYEQLKL